MLNIDAFERQIAERMAATPTAGFAIAIARGERVVVPPTFRGYIPRDKSVPLASLIDQAFVTGATLQGEDDLQIGPLRGRFVIEAMPFCVDDERRVLSVIHLGQGRVSR